MSPLRSSAGPATCRIETPSSRRMIWASEVLPSPGGPASRTWSSASPRPFAASSAIASCSLTRSWPTKSASERRAERALELLLAAVGDGGREHALAHAAAPQRRAHLLLDRQRLVDPGERPLGVDQRQPSSTSASRASSEPSPTGRGQLRAAPACRFSSITIRCASCGRCRGSPRSARGRRARSRGGARRWRRARDDRERHLRPDPGDAEQQLEELALLGAGEAVELERVVAHVEVGLDGRLLADARASRAASPRRGSRPRRRRARCPPRCARRPCRAGARSRDGPQERRRERVADRDRERVGGVVGMRRLVEARGSPSPSAAPAPCRRGRSRQTDCLTRFGAYSTHSTPADAAATSTAPRACPTESAMRASAPTYDSSSATASGACSAISSATPSKIVSSRSSTRSRAGVRQHPWQVALRRPSLSWTIPYPHAAVPGSMPRTFTWRG